MNYKGSLAYLRSLSVFGSQLGLRRIARLMELLGNPQTRYRTVHVTGTNGKGSVSAMLASILTQSGLRTGRYISPHLSSYTERIAIDGLDIAPQDFADMIAIVSTFATQVKEETGDAPTEFEILTAAAFLYFAKKEVDYAVIEVGLGGLLDSTNVIVPEISIITNVTMEHAQQCGGTLEGIAHHKAGIIKDGVPVVTAATGVPLDILRETAQEKNADLFVLGEDFGVDCLSFDRTGQKLSFRSMILGLSGEAYEIRLLGKYQAQNSAVAIMAAHILGQTNAEITVETTRKGLALASWPGRFELFEKDGKTIVVDGAHNPDGMRALRESLDTYFPVEGRVFLLGILKDKAIAPMLQTLLQPQDRVVTASPNSERAADAQFIAEEAQKMTAHAVAASSREEALTLALSMTGTGEILCIAGSLYLIGELRRDLLKS